MRRLDPIGGDVENAGSPIESADHQAAVRALLTPPPVPMRKPRKANTFLHLDHRALRDGSDPWLLGALSIPKM